LKMKPKLSNLKNRVATINTMTPCSRPVERLRGRPWDRIRQQVFKRDNYLCVECLGRGHIELAKEIDHLIPVCDGGGNNMENLIAICKACHRKKTDRENEVRNKK
jgi:5-methylcytosine-specific restriction endonuclease McrA